MYLFSSSSLIEVSPLLTVFCLYRKRSKFLDKMVLKFLIKVERKISEAIKSSQLGPVIGFKIHAKGNGKTGKRNKTTKKKFRHKFSTDCYGFTNSTIKTFSSKSTIPVKLGAISMTMYQTHRIL